MILLAGQNTALLEGLAQALANTGHRVVVAVSREEAEEAQARLSPILTVAERSLVSDGEPERVGGARVANNFFSFLGVPVARGRG